MVPHINRTEATHIKTTMAHMINDVTELTWLCLALDHDPGPVVRHQHWPGGHQGSDQGEDQYLPCLCPGPKL
jgi:hypothetical protein